MFLGNVYTGLFWKAHSDRTRDPRAIAHALDGIIRSDRLFTLPGALLILLTGYATARAVHISILSTPWVWQSLMLFAASGVMFSLFVAPTQVRLRALALGATDVAPLDWRLYRRLSHKWEFWGWAALVTPLAAVAVMVVK
jgi:uncharacterized membrane protein